MRIHLTALTFILLAAITATGCRTVPRHAGDIADAKRYDRDWIEKAIDHWPVRSEWVGGKANGTRIWYGKEDNEVARLSMKDGEPYRGVLFAEGAYDLRIIHVFEEGRDAGLGLFTLSGDGSWELFPNSIGEGGP